MKNVKSRHKYSKAEEDFLLKECTPPPSLFKKEDEASRLTLATRFKTKFPNCGHLTTLAITNKCVRVHELAAGGGKKRAKKSTKKSSRKGKKTLHNWDDPAGEQDKFVLEMKRGTWKQKARRFNAKFAARYGPVTVGSLSQHVTFLKKSGKVAKLLDVGDLSPRITEKGVAKGKETKTPARQPKNLGTGTFALKVEGVEVWRGDHYPKDVVVESTVTQALIR
jgi:hypothetical protein